MQPFFFGSSCTRLFGIHYPGDPAVQQGIVICPPMGQEYIRSHRTLKQLAIRLADAGFPVLRFDYFASGDSAGDSREATVRQWQRDIRTAIEELRGRRYLESITLIGLRLGASLAASVGGTLSFVDKLVLWDPIISGSEYLQQLSADHHQWILDIHGCPSIAGDIGDNQEFMGFVFNRDFISELQQLELTSSAIAGHQESMLIASDDNTAAVNWFKQLQSTTGGFQLGQHRLTKNSTGVAKPWQKNEFSDKAMVPYDNIREIVDWIHTGQAAGV